MAMTEDDARKKWCPMARVCVIGPDGEHMTSFNRTCSSSDDIDSFQTNGPMKCIASDCMMFKWGDNYDHGGDSTAERHNTANNRGGYCGLTK